VTDIELDGDGVVLRRADCRTVLALNHGLARTSFLESHRERLVYFLVATHETGPVVGSLMLERERRGASNVWVDCAILEAHRGRPYASRALKRAAEWARVEAGARRVLAEILDSNERSQRAARRAGFVRTTEKNGQIWEWSHGGSSAG
jgi:RimJ/RimL family protein N-acetyltransferase